MAHSFSCYKVDITLLILIVFISSSSANYKLNPFFYSQSCPQVFDIVRKVVTDAIENEPRMGASLLRLHFHDCFVNGCDGSILLDDHGSFKGEKSAGPNLNSVRGFDVVDNIKTELEGQCPGVVSCADILAIAASESLGGPNWFVGLGRKDALTASQADANKSLPAPTLDLKGLVSKFQKVGLSKQDLIVLSGAHTIGQARCTNFRTRIYNETNIIDSAFAQTLKRNCSKTSGKGDDNSAALDLQTPTVFDNSYYTNLVNKKGLLHSDQQLFNGDMTTVPIVRTYSENPVAFHCDFAKAMVKMGEISPLMGPKQGQIRKNCRKVNE
ncbi:peroxidase 4 [Phtheirospermum japonicum]|uniref:Peroxidase n=1 Tax=Phtheirospermum japonicum TaxID=374723 RepID=A0A830CYC5_9LAMI|nr:peroxidase 4 [Phtheirospermum japonicum]